MAHEAYQRAAEADRATPRSFGLLFAAVFAVLAGLAWWRDSTLLPASMAPIWLGLALVVLLVGLLRPDWLRAPLRGWMALGRALAMLFHPLVLLLMFCVLIVPLALWFRLIGRDPLRRRIDPKTDSYWIERDPEQELGPRMSRPF